MALVNFYTQITNDSRTVYMYIALISSVDLPQKAVPIPVPVNFIRGIDPGEGRTVPQNM